MCNIGKEEQKKETSSRSTADVSVGCIRTAVGVPFQYAAAVNLSSVKLGSRPMRPRKTRLLGIESDAIKLRAELTSYRVRCRRAERRFAVISATEIMRSAAACRLATLARTCEQIVEPRASISTSRLATVRSTSSVGRVAEVVGAFKL